MSTEMFKHLDNKSEGNRQPDKVLSTIVKTLTSLVIVATCVCICVYLFNRSPNASAPSHAEQLHNNLIHSIFPAYSEDSLFVWEAPVIEDVNSSEWPGEGGRGVEVPESEEVRKTRFKEHYFNILATDRIAFNRSLADTRNAGCLPKKYPAMLPSTSIVIVFHNEAWSTLIRTITSIIRTAPENLVEEIILVDDKSSKAYLKRRLELYIRNNITSYYPVRVMRQGQRSGLISARLLGASQARAKVLTFLDSHVECNEGWLEPLLSRIAEDRSRVVCPIIDVISEETFEYVEANDNLWGGFDWKVSFRWFDVSEKEEVRRKWDRTEPIRSPTMSGGLFAIDKQFFNFMGKYDEGMKIWGAENLEMSFRIWMCGGSIEIVPCSRIGHVFRTESPYTLPGGRDYIVQHNTKRLVDVWLDEWRMFYYTLYPEAETRKTGSIDKRLQLREMLNCSSFQWYLENIYPDSPLPRNYSYLGQIEHIESQQCFDTRGESKPNGEEVALVPCIDPPPMKQVFMYSKAKKVVYDESCLETKSETDLEVVLALCVADKSSQNWEFEEATRRLIHKISGSCLDMTEGRLSLTSCDKKATSQQWLMRNNFGWEAPTHSKV